MCSWPLASLLVMYNLLTVSVQFTVVYHTFLYFVLCTLFSVLWTLYSVLCTLYFVLCTLYSVLCTLYSVLCTLYSVLCTLYLYQIVLLCIAQGCIVFYCILFNCIVLYNNLEIEVYGTPQFLCNI